MVFCCGPLFIYRIDIIVCVCVCVKHKSDNLYFFIGNILGFLNSSDYVTWCDGGYKRPLFLHLFPLFLWDVCKSGLKTSMITKLCPKCSSWAEIASVLNLRPLEMMWDWSERRAAVHQQKRATVDAWIVNTILFSSHIRGKKGVFVLIFFLP